MESTPNNLLKYAAKVAADLLLCKDYITVPLPMANMLGLERAVLLKTIDNWCNSNETRESPNHFKNGHYWTYGSYDEWAKRIRCLGSARSIQRLFLSLEQEGLLVSDVLNTFKGDRRKWYRVDHEKLGLLYLAEAEKQEKEAETQAQSIVPKVDDHHPEENEYKYIVPKVDDGHTKTGTTIVPKVDDGSAKNGCSNTKTYYKDIEQRLDSLSEEERENFFKFVQEEWKKTTGQDIISFERFLAKKADFDNWHQRFLAKQETIATQSTPEVDWTQHPDWDKWVKQMRFSIPRFRAFAADFGLSRDEATAIAATFERIELGDSVDILTGVNAR